MIHISLKPGQIRSNQGGGSRSVYFVSSLMNWHSNPNPNIWRPPTDVYEMEDKIIVRVEIAGMSTEMITVNFNQGILTIHGTRSEISEKRAFHQMEIHFGEFYTEVEIPISIVTEAIQATYQDGFLLIVLPKASPRQIKITQE